MNDLNNSFSAETDHGEKIVYFHLRDDMSSRSAVECMARYLRDHRDGSGYDCIVDCRFWDGYFAFEDIEWLSQRYAGLFEGAPPSIKLAIITFDALLAALKSPTKTLFPTHAIQAFESVTEAKAWISSAALK